MKLTDNVRPIIGLDDSTLRESMRAVGWIEILPAIKDENGCVISGNRRLKIATEENIEPVIRVVTYGSGQTADLKRRQDMVASNTGGIVMTKADRKRLAEEMYNKGMTQMVIAQALCVSQWTISQDLKGLEVTSKPPRPKGGRPKAKRKVVPKRHPKADEIMVRVDAGITSTKIAAELDLEGRAVRHVIEREAIAREAKAEPIINREDLSLTAQQKLDTAIRQYRKKLDLEFAEKVRLKVKAEVSHWLEYYKDKVAHCDAVIKIRKGVMPRKTYRKILACLHPDRSMSDETLTAAFSAFEKLERVLVSEEEMPTPLTDWPSSYEELMEKKRKVKEANSQRAKAAAAKRKDTGIARR